MWRASGIFRHSFTFACLQPLETTALAPSSQLPSSKRIHPPRQTQSLFEFVPFKKSLIAQGRSLW